jgi:hypothetical protein
VLASWEGGVTRRPIHWPAAVLLAVLVGGCATPGASPQPSGSPTVGEATPAVPSPSPTDTAAPTVAPTPAESPVAVASESPAADPCKYAPYDGTSTIAPLKPGQAVRISVAELNLREGPCTGSPLLGTLPKGRILIVRDYPYGPVKSGGYAWYQVVVKPNTDPVNALPPLPDSPFPDGTDSAIGWVAVHDGTHPYVTPLAARCPAAPDLENVIGMLPAEWLACFDGPIVLQGTYGCGGCGGAGGPVGSPNWLADIFEFEQLHLNWSDSFSYRPIGLHFTPTGPAKPTEGSIIKVTVHVDDLAASTCTFVWGIDPPPFNVPELFAVAWCRERFVVDSYEVLGTDPAYPG